jgi:hypothetical protein
MAVMRGPSEKFPGLMVIETKHHGGKVRHGSGMVATALRDVPRDYLLEVVTLHQGFSQFVEDESLVKD